MIADPVANLLVIRSPDMERAVSFYIKLGLSFVRHAHGKGPEHYASETGGFVFEIYPQRNAADSTTNVRLGFQVANVDDLVEDLRNIQATILTEPADTQWGRRAVVKDLDGHTIELVTSALNSPSR